jgi:hypothetical protein
MELIDLNSLPLGAVGYMPRSIVRRSATGPAFIPARPHVYTERPESEPTVPVRRDPDGILIDDSAAPIPIATEAGLPSKSHPRMARFGPIP